MLRYVCGFYFNEDATKVALIRKNRPDWQAGKLNGIVGKCEKDDEDIYEGMDLTMWHCMVREFEEETGVFTNTDQWSWFSAEGIPDEWICYFFYSTGDLSRLRTMTDEVIEIHNVDDIFTLPVIDNLKELIPEAAGQIDVYGKYSEDYQGELKEREVPVC